MQKGGFDISDCNLTSKIPDYMNPTVNIDDKEIEEATKYLREIGYEDDLYPYFSKDND